MTYACLLTIGFPRPPGAISVYSPYHRNPWGVYPTGPSSRGSDNREEEMDAEGSEWRLRGTKEEGCCHLRV